MSAALRLMRGMEIIVTTVDDLAQREYIYAQESARHHTTSPAYRSEEEQSEVASAADVEYAVRAMVAAFGHALDVMEEHVSAWHTGDESEMEAGDE